MKPKVKLRILVGLIFTLLSFFSVPIVTVWKKSQVVEMVALNESLKEKARLLRSENIVLRYSISKLKARDRIETLAQTQCGLIYPDNANVTVLILPEADLPAKAQPLPLKAVAMIR